MLMGARKSLRGNRRRAIVLGPGGGGLGEGVRWGRWSRDWHDGDARWGVVLARVGRGLHPRDRRHRRRRWRAGGRGSRGRRWG